MYATYPLSTTITITPQDSFTCTQKLQVVFGVFCLCGKKKIAYLYFLYEPNKTPQKTKQNKKQQNKTKQNKTKQNQKKRPSPLSKPRIKSNESLVIKSDIIALKDDTVRNKQIYSNPPLTHLLGLFTYRVSQYTCCPVGWSCRIHRLHLCSGV